MLTAEIMHEGGDLAPHFAVNSDCATISLAKEEDMYHVILIIYHKGE